MGISTTGECPLHGFASSFALFSQLAEQRKTTIDEMAANSLQADEKARSTLQNLKEKHRADVERLEKEIDESKVRRRVFQSWENKQSQRNLALLWQSRRDVLALTNINTEHLAVSLN